MTHPLLALIEHKRRFQKIRSLPFTKLLRRRLSVDYFRHFVFRQYDALNSQTSVAGYRVPFCILHNFEHLYSEVFVKHSYWLNLRSARPVILDAGSNIGMSVLFFHLLWPEARITAFEPQPAAFNCLSQFIRLNQLEPNISAHQVALAATEGQLDFFIDEASPGSLLASLDSDRMSQNCISVTGKRLSSFINGPIDLLKMDVEGNEFDVLTDLVESTAIRSVQRIVLEYHHHIDRERDDLSNLLKLLEEAGFGYHIECKMGRPFPEYRFQDMLVYAYSKRQ